MTYVVSIVSILFGGGLFAFAQFLIDRRDKETKEDKGVQKFIEDQKKVNSELELNLCQLQLMVLMADYPHKVAEILKVAEHYFVDLNGDFFITTLFKEWLETNGIEKPTWFDPNK